jgi:diguanylate cyclase (GGDEF)-like protein
MQAKKLLDLVERVTRCRRRGQVEAEALAAINALAGARRTRLYKIFTPPEDVLVGLSVEIAAGAAEAASFDDGFSWPAQTGSIENEPHLLACLGRDEPCSERLPDGSARFLLLLRNERGEPYGFLEILRESPLGADEIAVVQGFAVLLRNCLATLEYSETDTLTRLLNRKSFDEYLIGILANIPAQDDAVLMTRHLPQRRQIQPEARDHWLGVMDIDHFKSINDRFGHLIGDEVLILMANLMRASFRMQDKLFRFGGEEFVALLRPTELANATAVFERFRNRVAAYSFPQVGKVTVSIGFARIRSGDTASVILGAADEALYWAKEHGRNQCHAYEALVAAGSLQAAPEPVSDFELF